MSHPFSTMIFKKEPYFKNVRSHEHIENLGKKLYIKITEVIHSEVEEISEQDCINYLIQLVINRTFDGYITEIKTIYGQLEKELGLKIEPAPDNWDRLYNVDLWISFPKSKTNLSDYKSNLSIKAYSLHKFLKKKSFNNKHT